jgi:formylglycine-generating enzyme required for sulfatase activity
VEIPKEIEKGEKKDPAPPPKEIEKEKEKPPAPLAKQITNSTGMKLVLIPPGKFIMGSPRTEIGRRHDIDDEHAHEVEITKPFYLGQYEVKVGEFTAFVTATGYRTEGEKARDGNGTWRNPGFTQTPRHPVVGVTWNDALSFCEWLSEQEGKTYRLPTEAEWEYSCRAGAQTRFSSGNDEASLKKVAHYVGSRPQTVQPNAFALYDMHGNVWEWCQDWYDKDYYRNSPKLDPQGPVTGTFRVMRGGSYYNEARHCRAAYRDCHPASRRTNAVGFRVVCVP